MDKFKITLLNQYKLFLMMCLLCLLPYTMVKLYLPEVPYVPIYFFMALFFIKLLSFNDQDYKKRIRSVLSKQYQSHYKKSLNKSDLEKYTALQITSRNAVLVIIGFTIVIFEIIFNS